MSAGGDRKDRQSAVEDFEEEVNYWTVRNQLNILRRNVKPKGEVTITLPSEVWSTVLACAKDGMHKGAGRKHPRMSRLTSKRIATAVVWARDLKRRSVASGKKATGNESAEDKAAQKASDELRERHGILLAMSTIRRLMQSEG